MVRVPKREKRAKPDSPANIVAKEEARKTLNQLKFERSGLLRDGDYLVASFEGQEGNLTPAQTSAIDNALTAFGLKGKKKIDISHGDSYAIQIDNILLTEEGAKILANNGVSGSNGVLRLLSENASKTKH